MTLFPLQVSAGGKRYPVIIKRGVLSTVGERLAEDAPGARVFIVTDETVWAIYGKPIAAALEAQKISFHVEAVPPGEQTKSIESLTRLYAAMAAQNYSRSDWVLTVGGGVVGDLGGMAAATFLRGMSYAQVPTTLLAQVDSSVGGKVAVDIPAGKNLVGAFHQPRFVLIDPDVLDTLPDSQFASGMAEVIKHAAISDEGLFKKLEKYSGRQGLNKHLPEVIRQNIVIKRAAVQNDERDNGNRMTLNFGHTIGHGLEQQAGFTGITHGEAVSKGMCHITRVSEALGLTQPGTADRLAALCRAYGLPVELPDASRESLLEVILRDKKVRGETITLSLISQIGKCFLHTIRTEEMGRFL